APTDPRALPTVMHRSALLASGVTADEIQRSRRTGQWQTLARGTYCEAAPAAGLNREQQHRLRARALADRSPHLVISHISAAAVLEIPVASTVVAAEAALRRRWAPASALADALADTRHRRGAAAGRRALLFADGRSES